MKFMISFLNKDRKNIIILYFSKIIFLGLAFTISIINTRYLAPENYGIYAFVIGFFTFFSIFYDFGFFSAGARFLATNKKKQVERRTIGLLIILNLSFGLLLILTMLTANIFVKKYKPEYSPFLYPVIPLSFIMPFDFLIQIICQSINKIRILAFYNIFSKLIYLIFILFSLHFSFFTLKSSLYFSFISLIIVTILVIIFLKPKFTKPFYYFSKLLKLNRQFGFKIYISRVITTSTYNLDKIFLAFLYSSSDVAYYSLAFMIVQPLSLFSESIKANFFRLFAQEKYISKRPIKYNTIWLIITTTILVTLSMFMLTLIFGDNYAPAKKLIIPLALAVFFQGMNQVYIGFFSAKGEGDIIKKVALITTIINIVFNFIFIYYFGAMGAAITSLLSMLIAYLTYYFNYKKKYIETK